MNIYNILSSKPHDPHYLSKYNIFIEQCQQKNVGYTGYTETHHICPKAKDMFPEYEIFRDNPWNCAVLTPRQHFIAHIMLWKIFPSVNSVAYAAHSMRNYQNKKICSKLYQNLNEEFRKFQSSQVRNWHANMTHDAKKSRSEKISTASKNMVMAKTIEGNVTKVSVEEYNNRSDLFGVTKGMTTVKDIEGVFHHVRVDDPRIKSGELSGPNKGRVVSDDTRKKLSDAHKGKRRGPMKEDTKKKLSESKKGRIRNHQEVENHLKSMSIVHKCPYCNKKVKGKGNFNRWHGNNCKLRGHDEDVCR